MKYKNPLPTVDIIIQVEDKGAKGIVLIERKNPPHGWALPGGFVDYGESLEEAAVREAMEETGIAIILNRQFHTYSHPSRDPRKHTITTVYIAEGKGYPTAADDAINAGVFTRENLPSPLVFDHPDILEDYFNNKY